MSAVCVISETAWLTQPPSKKRSIAKDTAAVPVLVQYVIDGECILQDFGEDGVSCLSKEDFDTLATGEEEANIGVNLRVSA